MRAEVQEIKRQHSQVFILDDAVVHGPHSEPDMELGQGDRALIVVEL